ncbi:MAG: hypothetical protein ACLUD2_19475 [Clostridium sp.]
MTSRTKSWSSTYPDEELARRRAAFRYEPKQVDGYLKRYALHARSADQAV